MKRTLFAAAAVAVLAAGASTASAQECIGGFKELGNHVIVGCDDYGSMGLYAPAPRYDRPVVGAYDYPPVIYDEPVFTGSIVVGGDRGYDRRHYRYDRHDRYSRSDRFRGYDPDSCRPGFFFGIGGGPYTC